MPQPMQSDGAPPRSWVLIVLGAYFLLFGLYGAYTLYPLREVLFLAMTGQTGSVDAMQNGLVAATTPELLTQIIFKTVGTALSIVIGLFLCFQHKLAIVFYAFYCLSIITQVCINPETFLFDIQLTVAVISIAVLSVAFPGALMFTQMHAFIPRKGIL